MSEKVGGAKPTTIERCQKYVERHADKPTAESRAFADLLVIVKDLQDEIARLKPLDEPQRDLTVNGGLRWLARWDDVPLANWPHSVRLLTVFANTIEWHRGQREKMIEEMNRLFRDAAAMKESTKLSLEVITLTKEPT